MGQGIDEATVKQLLWRGYTREGKSKDLPQEIERTRTALAIELGVPIDICLVNEGVLNDVPPLEGLCYVGRRYIPAHVWYLGNIASADHTPASPSEVGFEFRPAESAVRSGTARAVPRHRDSAQAPRTASPHPHGQLTFN